MIPKIIAMYLPQYHEVQENNEFWGKGFTDWIGVKAAKPLFVGHQQPRIPLNGNYYDLANADNIRWQASLAQKYGIYGFGIYHYWFSSEKQMLTKPAELLLENKDIGIHFLFAWDNISWKRTWSKIKGNAWAPIHDEQRNEGVKNIVRQKNEPEILIEYKLGNEDEWKKHFDYLLPYFLDERYIKEDGKPVFLIYHYDEKIYRMADYWDLLSKEAGFAGIQVVYRFDDTKRLEAGRTAFFYEPIYSGWGSVCSRAMERVKNGICGIFKVKRGSRIYSYSKIWEKIMKRARRYEGIYSGAFVSYDETPRRGERGIIVKGAQPELFEKYMERLFKISKDKGKEYIFLTAWNEWGEGAYLEPDEMNGFGYLEALLTAIGHCGGACTKK